MGTLQLNYHSFVDVITNSSSELYMTAKTSAAQHVEKLIDMLLAAAKSELTCDDLFNIKVVNDEGDFDNDCGGVCYDRPKKIILEPKQHSGVVQINLTKQLKQIVDVDSFER